MKWVEHHEFLALGSNPCRDETLGDLFPFVLALVDRVNWFLLLVVGGRYPVELIEVRRKLAPTQQY